MINCQVFFCFFNQTNISLNIKLLHDFSLDTNKEAGQGTLTRYSKEKYSKENSRLNGQIELIERDKPG